MPFYRNGRASTGGGKDLPTIYLILQVMHIIVEVTHIPLDILFQILQTGE